MRNRVIIIVLFGVLATLLLVFFMSGSKPKLYQWRESYTTASNQPYGTKFIRELLKGYRADGDFIFNDKKPLHQLLDTTGIDSADYVFIGMIPYLDEADRQALLKFIASGNDAFISCKYLPVELFNDVYVNECGRDMFIQEEELPTATFNFYHSTLRTTKGYQFTYHEGKRNYPYKWHAINNEVFCDSTTQLFPLGFQGTDKVNYCRIPYGEGNLYFHTEPIAFTNYFMSKADKVDYASAVFSHLKGEKIIWDEFSKSEMVGDSSPKSSPLAYFLEQPSLKYAWWMMLCSALLYTLFAAKRIQRVIPVLDEKVNTSLEYVKMIAALHYENGNHEDIARKKMKYFLYYIRTKYGIHAQPFGEKDIERLTEKSKIEREKIQFIISEFGQIDSNLFNARGADRLLRLYEALEYFYKHCK